MQLLKVVVSEFISIVEALEQDNAVENDRIIIEREQFKNILERYAYINFREKVSIYKILNFIIHDRNNYTMPCKDKNTKKAVRKVVINYTAYKMIKYLFETNIEI